LFERLKYIQQYIFCNGFFVSILLYYIFFTSKIAPPRFKITVVSDSSLISGIPDSKFSNKWHRKFLSRHKELSLRIASTVSGKKMNRWTPEVCEKWIELLETLHEDGFLDDPDTILNLDESAFKLGESFIRVHAQRGQKHAPAIKTGNDRIQLTVLAAGFASGRMLRPLVLYDGLNNLASRFENTHNQILLATNNSGMMDGHVLTQYATREIFPNMKMGKVSYKF